MKRCRIFRQRLFFCQNETAVLLRLVIFQNKLAEFEVYWQENRGS